MVRKKPLYKGSYTGNQTSFKADVPSTELGGAFTNGDTHYQH